MHDATPFTRNDIIRLARVNNLAWEYPTLITAYESARITTLVTRRFVMKDDALISNDEREFLKDVMTVLNPSSLKGNAA